MYLKAVGLLYGKCCPRQLFSSAGGVMEPLKVADQVDRDRETDQGSTGVEKVSLETGPVDLVE